MTSGRLYIVPTPIGNLSDISDRARQILAEADLIACEDTRTSSHLLNHLNLRKKLVAYHDHNEAASAPALADQIAGGSTIALISDAGTPAISDPGFRLVRECRRRNLPVTPLPGPCAITTALSASGLPTHAFYFAGFLPPKTSARTTFLEKHRDADHTLILYESSHRIAKFADEILATLGPDRVICIAKELTKIHETILTGTSTTVHTQLQKLPQKGEFVVLIAPQTFTL